MKPTPHPSEKAQDEGKKTGGGVVKPEYRERYGKDKHCGDDIAAALKAATTDDKGKTIDGACAKIAKANKIDFGKWSHLNAGLQRMNLGNALRGLHRNGHDVVIGDKTIKGAKVEKKETKKKEAA